MGFLLKIFSPSTGWAFGLILLAAVVTTIGYGSHRIDALKLENSRLAESVDELDTQLLQMEQNYEQQKAAILLALQQQTDIRQLISKKKNRVATQTGVRQHAATQNPDALGDAITGNLADIMQQLQSQTSNQ